MITLRSGDRIQLVRMDDDPDPVAPGTRGTVVNCWSHGTGRDIWCQADVRWDNGRGLMLTMPPDVVRVTGEVYRDHVIERCDRPGRKPGKYEIRRAEPDGEPTRWAGSVEEARELIDELEDKR